LVAPPLPEASSSSQVKFLDATHNTTLAIILHRARTNNRNMIIARHFVRHSRR